MKHDEPLFVGFDGAEEGAVKKGDASGSQLEEMVNSMLPPREWTQASGTWMQYVSKKTASRLDVISLQEDLDKRPPAPRAAPRRPGRDPPHAGGCSSGRRATRASAPYARTSTASASMSSSDRSRSTGPSAACCSCACATRSASRWTPTRCCTTQA